MTDSLRERLARLIGLEPTRAEPAPKSGPVPARPMPRGPTLPRVPGQMPSLPALPSFNINVPSMRDLVRDERTAELVESLMRSGGVGLSPVLGAFSKAALEARREVLENAARIAGTALDDADFARLLSELSGTDPAMLHDLAVASGALNPLEQAHRDADRLGTALDELACVDELGPIAPPPPMSAAVRLFDAMVEVADACLYWVRDDGNCHCCALRDRDARPEVHDEGCPVGELAAALRAFSPGAEAVENAVENLQGSLVDEAIEAGHPGGEFEPVEDITVPTAAGPVPAGKVLARVLVCRNCGSLVDYGRNCAHGMSRLLDWCPACNPGTTNGWRYGPVLAESDDAARARLTPSMSISRFKAP